MENPRGKGQRDGLLLQCIKAEGAIGACERALALAKADPDHCGGGAVEPGGGEALKDDAADARVNVSDARCRNLLPFASGANDHAHRHLSGGCR